MPARKTDSEFGGRGGPLPPAEFVVTEDLDAVDQARLDRWASPTDASETRETTRGRVEKRAGKSDVVGNKAR